MTLFHSVEPFLDESLPGLIARAAALNRYPRSLDVLVQCGASPLRPEAIALRDLDIADALADAMGTAPERVLRLFHPAGQRKSTLDFFGVDVRSKLREPLRRISPAALAVDDVPYVRAMWHLRPLTFDRSTGSLLITHCPECEKSLSFTITKGIATCEHCEYDLRKHDAGLVHVEDPEALDFAARLVDPLESSRPALHPDLDRLDRGALFELVIGLGCALMMNAGATRPVSRENSSRGGISHVEPQALARAARALLDWPNGFVTLCRAEADRMQDRELRYGAIKELGAVAVLVKDELLDDAGRDVVKAGMKQYFMETPSRPNAPRPAELRLNDVFVGAKDLIRKHGVNQTIVRGLVKRGDVMGIRSKEAKSSPYLLLGFVADGILERYKDLRSEESIAAELGVPPSALRDLADRDILKPGKGVENDLRRSDFNYSQSSYDFLFGFMRDVLPITGKVPGFVPYAEVMLMFPAGRQPWAPLIEDILWGKVAAVFHRQPTEKALLAALSVEMSSINLVDLQRRQLDFPERQFVRVPTLVANLILGIRKYEMLLACVNAKLLTPDKKKTLAYSEVMQFASDYILTSEIAARTQRDSKGVAAWLRVHKVFPKLEVPSRGGVYRRSDVEAVISRYSNFPERPFTLSHEARDTVDEHP